MNMMEMIGMKKKSSIPRTIILSALGIGGAVMLSRVWRKDDIDY